MYKNVFQGATTGTMLIAMLMHIYILARAVGYLLVEHLWLIYLLFIFFLLNSLILVFAQDERIGEASVDAV